MIDMDASRPLQERCYQLHCHITSFNIAVSSLSPQEWLGDVRVRQALEQWSAQLRECRDVVTQAAAVQGLSDMLQAGASELTQDAIVRVRLLLLL